MKTPSRFARRSLAVCCAVVLFVPRAGAQSTHYTFDRTTRTIGTIETTAGFVVNERLSRPITGSIVTGSIVTEVEPVGDEVWVGVTSGGVLRLDAATLTPIDVKGPDYNVRAIVPNPSGGATVFGFKNGDVTQTEVRTLDAAADVQSSVPVDYLPDDAVAIGGDFAVVVNDEVQRVDGATLQITGTWVTGADALADAASTFYSAAHLFKLPGNNLAVSSFVHVVVADANGAARRIYNVGSFETAAVGGDAGELAVLSSDRTTLVDIGSGAETDQVDLGYGGITPLVSTHPRPASRNSARICPSGLNSTGRAARAALLASLDAADAAVTLVGSRMPPGQAAVPFYGLEAPPTPFGTGQLCIHGGGGNLVRAPIAVVGAGGATETRFDFRTEGLGAEFAAGTSWVFQLAFRDSGGSGVDVTDAVVLNFRP